MHAHMHSQDPAFTGIFGMPRPKIAAMAVFPEDPQGEFIQPLAPGQAV